MYLTGNPTAIFYLYHRHRLFRLLEDRTIFEQPIYVCENDCVEMLEINALLGGKDS